MMKKTPDSEENAKWRDIKKLKDQRFETGLSSLPLDELRFFNVEPADVGKRWNDVIFGEIADAYTLIQFNKKSVQDSDSRERGYVPANFLLTLLRENIRKELNERKAKGQPPQNFSARQRADNEVVLARQYHHSYWRHKFSHPPEAEYRRDLKTLLNDKKKVFTSLQQHYCVMQEKARVKKKKLTLLPLSIFLEREDMEHFDAGSAYKRLKARAALLTRQFPKVLKILRHRSPYVSFLGYSKLVMVTDTAFEPFLHVIFYLSEGDLNTWYAHDISKTWNIISGYRVKVHYYSFTGELAEPPNHVMKKIADTIPDYELYYRDVLLPFSSEDPNRDEEAAITISEVKQKIAHLEEYLQNQFQNQKVKKKTNGQSRVHNQIKELNKLLKSITERTENKRNHLNYMARVAKNYNAIPGITTFTQAGSFTYDNQYSNEKYRARKERKQPKKITGSNGGEDKVISTDNREHLANSAEVWDIPEGIMYDDM
ncbi:hypothetical protein FML26_25935 [Klebsiella michiganensis]|uniref:hypothetical protein n=1 Tax=Klebsiella michiganensis TaxID=1134687 RepID=UPI001CCDEFE4|nr:hypothetical protein [Klebsiella michiganensis]MBZ7680459.1 hypothetical protein [Klebsiella michiganensis]